MEKKRETRVPALHHPLLGAVVAVNEIPNGHNEIRLEQVDITDCISQHSHSLRWSAGAIAEDGEYEGVGLVGERQVDVAGAGGEEAGPVRRLRGVRVSVWVQMTTVGQMGRVSGLDRHGFGGDSAIGCCCWPARPRRRSLVRSMGWRDDEHGYESQPREPSARARTAAEIPKHVSVGVGAHGDAWNEEKRPRLIGCQEIEHALPSQSAASKPVPFGP